MSKIYDIQNIPTEIIGQVGGKARGLNRLKAAGYNVPQAFIITDIQDGDTYDDAARKYSDEMMSEVAVRSSATLEDGNDYSAAGQFSTFLNVSGADALKQAAADCVESLHNVTAENYAKTFLQSAQSSMTVVVQRMVKARCAGVIFTKAPMRPGYVLVEAVPGLGENLVSGKMSAQQYRVRDNSIEEMPANPILSEKEAIELGRLGIEIEKLFGQPMDLEWAIDENGTIQWLQARPITIEESVTMNELDCPIDVSHSVITTSNIGEVMPGAVTPLNLSTNMYALDWGVKETYREIGCVTYEVPPYSYICSYYNHMFFNMSSMYTVTPSTYGTSKETMDLAICGRVLDGFPNIDMKNRPVWRRTLNTMIFLRFVFSGEAAKKGMKRTIDSLKFDLSQDMNGIYSQIINNFDTLKWVQYYHYCTSYYSGGQSNMLINFLGKDFPDKPTLQSAIAGCLTEIDDFESANVLRMMRSLAATMLQYTPDVASYDVHQLMEYMENGATDAIRAKYEAFMEKHGHRGIREMEIRCPSWKSNRQSFFTSLHSVLQSLGNEINKPEKSWKDYAEELLYNCKGRRKKMMYGFIEKARKGVCYREYTKSMVVYALDLYKQAYSKLSVLMTETGLLPDADCIYFLTQDEVGELLKGNTGLVKKALARRRLFPQQEALKFPDVSLGIPQPLEARSRAEEATSFSGTPVSRGIASGKARIVRSEADAALLQKGEIMVAGCTDIGWTPYYNIIGGLVTEIGSALSHGIVVAREYALPAVVNIDNALQEIHTGDEITIDGNTGTVFIDKKI